MIKILPHITEAKTSVSGFLNKEDIKAIAKNALKFSLPAVIVFFGQLQLGVAIKPALLVAALTLYGLIVDYLKKLNDGKKK